MSDTMSVVERAVQAAGGGAELARQFGLTRQAIYHWERIQRIPPHYVLRVEELSGISRHELAPDLYPAPTEAAE